MRSVLLALALAAGTSSASAEVWRMRYGDCGEWRGRWRVEEERSGVWDGIIDFEHVGGPCVQGTGSRSVSRVRAVLAGDAFFATRRGEHGAICNAYGQINGNRVWGFELCEGRPTRDVFALRFPPAADKNLQGPEAAQPDEYLEDPRTYRRDRAPGGFDQELRLGQGRP
jgi:hypothetical protein